MWLPYDGHKGYLTVAIRNKNHWIQQLLWGRGVIGRACKYPTNDCCFSLASACLVGDPMLLSSAVFPALVYGAMP